MQYRRLGRTEIEVSELSFGSHLKTANKEDPEGRERQIHAGLDCGINLFDIYEHSYKQFKPMSAALAHVRDEVVLSLVTVWRAAEEVMEEVEYALDVFKRDTIDLYRLVLRENYEDSDARLEGLLKAKEQGKIRAIGGVVHYPQHIIDGLKRYPDAIEYAMVPASFCAPLLMAQDGELAQALQQHDVGVIAMKPMAAADEEGGYIFKLHPQSEELEALRRKGLTLGKLAVKYVLQSPVVSSVLPAMNSIEEVREDAAASGDGPMTGDEKRFLDIYREEADRVFPEMLREDNYWVGPWQK
ncbi:aldo/keto reductase [Candidatus Latescibacterota bacterium]